jgi:hypothetical protein
MTKVTGACKDHCDSTVIGSGDRFIISLATPRLHNDRNASIDQQLWTV